MYQRQCLGAEVLLCLPETRSQLLGFHFKICILYSANQANLPIHMCRGTACIYKQAHTKTQRLKLIPLTEAIWLLSGIMPALLAALATEKSRVSPPLGQQAQNQGLQLLRPHMLN